MPAKFALHKQQLFHWIGRHIDEKKLSREKTADLYIEALGGSLKNGLWVKSPEVPEEIWMAGEAHPLELPMVCFTEWSLGQSFDHTKRYGRMGLGFSRKWVMQKHGQPVTYFKNNKNSKFKKACVRLKQESAGWKKSSQDALKYLLHFAKPSKAQVIATPPNSSPGKSTSPKTAKRPKPDPFQKKHGASMQFMEEREWRIVRNKGMKISLKTNPATLRHISSTTPPANTSTPSSSPTATPSTASSRINGFANCCFPMINRKWPFFHWKKSGRFNFTTETQGTQRF